MSNQVTVNTGTIEALDYAKQVPKTQWHNLVIRRSSYCRTNLYADCRDFLRFIQEAEELEMWKELGYADLNEFIRDALRINPELINWASQGLQIMSVPGAKAPSGSERR
jgi:hypothetical protein